jgi:excisionase family DNA binding protein
MERLLSIPEVAELIGIKSSTLYKLVSSRKIPFKKIGARVLFDPDEVRVWVDQRSVTPLEPTKIELP